MRSPVPFGPWFLAALVPAALAAQSPARAERAVASITPQDIARRIGVIAHDSMRGRDTPSPELDEVASYIAGEFRRFGLKPGGDEGTLLQRYGIVHTVVDTAATELRIAGATTVALRAGADLNLIRFPGLPLPVQPVSGPVVLLSGPSGAGDPLGGADVRGAWIAQVLSATPAGLQLDLRTIQAALRGGAAGVLIVSDRSDSAWRTRMRQVLAPTVGPEGAALPDTVRLPGLVEVRDAHAAALGLDVAAERARATRAARRLEGVTVTLRAAQRVAARVTAPNVVGVLEGSDPRLQREYVVFSAHMDHVGAASPTNRGCRAQDADSVCNGADDDASGTVAVVELAEAFAQLQPRPKRSLIFLTVSGEEQGLWGSAHFADRPPVPIADIVADLNLDMVGRNWTDTIAVIGKEHSDLGATLNRLAAAHPELRMTPIDDIWPQERFYFRSDHYNFARKGVPILFFFNGTHPDYHQASDHADKIDAEKESRIVKLVFYLGLEIANAPERPKWNPESYRRIVTGGGR